MSITKRLAPTCAPTFMLVTLLLLLSQSEQVNGQENAQLQIPPSLVQCYNTSFYMNRDNRLPANIQTLITLIEKVENSNNYNMDIRSLSVALMQLFRQDGIQKAPNVNPSAGVLPYSPTGFQFPKYRVLVSRLIPGNAFNFPNSSLTPEEFCSMHFLLSSSFDLGVRGDENQVCNRLSQYRAQRLPRDAATADDVELLPNTNTKARARATKPISKANYGVDFGWSEVDYGYSGSGNTNNNEISQCPVENGVMWTPWGSVTAGSVIAGIAAGLQQQTIQLRTLLQLSRRPGGPSQSQSTTLTVDNRWAATLAGDLAEVALVQVPTSTDDSANVGANGAWNDTVMAKWYFLTQRKNLEMTDAEIRGDLDGLILAMNVANWYTQVPTLKLSQLLRMYYSPNGVLTSGIRACDRKTNFPTYAPLQTMAMQAAAFAQVLDSEMRLTVTLSSNAIMKFSTTAATALQSYVPQYLNDKPCEDISNAAREVADAIMPMTNVFVFLDTSWSYNNVVDYLIYILQRLNINPYASTVTLLSASNADIIVNYTNYLSDVYEQWNATTQQKYSTGFNLPNVLRSLTNMTQAYMNALQTNNSVGGLSLVALMMPYMSTISDSDSSYAQTQLQYLYEQVPGVNIVFYSGGMINRFSSFVRDPSQDLFALNMGSNVAASAGPVVNRIEKFPRLIVNPNCGANWYTTNWGTTNSMYQYISPNTTNFYGLASNYFFPTTTGRYVNIQSQNGIPLTVCGIRSTILPSLNNTNTNDASQYCTQVTSNTYAYDLSKACDGYPTITQCPDLFITVTYANSSSTVSCTDKSCQSPDQAKFTISVVNMGCNSGVAQLLASFAMIISKSNEGTCDVKLNDVHRQRQLDFVNSTTIITNICIFLDTTWPYRQIVDYVNFVVEGLNINPHASAVTLLAASNGAIIVNTTNYLSSYYEQWNISTHSLYPMGFSLPIVLNKARDLAEELMIRDQTDSSLGGQSLVALLMPSPLAYVNELDYDYSRRYMDNVNWTVPDLHFIYFAGGAVVRFKDFVRHPHEDLFPLDLDTSVTNAATPVVTRLWQVPRRISNPNCGSTWPKDSRCTGQLVQYARLGSRNYYRLMPNYFYGYVSMRYLKVVAISGISFTVCTSRIIPLPLHNTSSDPPGQQCSQTTTHFFSYDLTDICGSDTNIQQCAPLYMSVQAQNFGEISQITCKDDACQTPAQAQYRIEVNNLNCNGVRDINFNISLLIIVFILCYLSIDLI